MASLHLILILLGIASIAESVCDDGWVRHGSTCYHFSHDKETWFDAMGMCKLIGGSLLEINDAEENNFVAGQITTRANYAPFLALSDVREENVWNWMISSVKLTNSSYTNWMHGQPDNLHHVQNCAIMGHGNGGKWFDTTCSDIRYYVCERKDVTVEIVG